MIQFSKVSFGYHTSKPLFSGLDWTVERGSTVGLAGPNGSGKSTLLRLAAGLLHAQKGSVRIDNEPVWPRSRVVSGRLFYMSEDFALPGLSVEGLARTFGVFYPQFSLHRFGELVEQFELQPKNSIGQLSFGGVKKVILAFGLATGADVLLLDEPTNGLDPSAKEVLSAQLALAASEGATTIISTHHLEAIEPLLSHLVILDKGQIMLRASCRELAERFRFGTVDPAHALYSRHTLGGYYGIERAEHTNGTLDLNLLYEAVRKNPQSFSDFK